MGGDLTWSSNSQATVLWLTMTEFEDGGAKEVIKSGDVIRTGPDLMGLGSL